MIYPNTPSDGAVFSLLEQTLGIEAECWKRALGSTAYLKDISEKTVLDLGCGFGSTFIFFLKKNGYRPKEFIHMDADPRVFLRERPYGGFCHHYDDVKELFYDWDKDRKIVADAQNIPLEDRSVDIVNQSMLLAGNPSVNADRVVGEVKRVLRKGGLYIGEEGFTGHLGKKECRGYDPCFKELNLDRPPCTVLQKIKD